MRKNLTLALDGELLKAARRMALDRDTTVNRLVHDYLTQLVADTGRQQAVLKRIRKSFRETPIRPAPRAWKREDLHDR